MGFLKIGTPLSWDDVQDVNIHSNNQDIIQNKENVKRKISNIDNNINNINSTLTPKVGSNYSGKNSDTSKKYDNEEKSSNTLSENNSKIPKKGFNHLFKIERANLIKKKQTDIIQDDIIHDNHFKKISNNETTQLLNVFVPFDLDPPTLYADTPETVRSTEDTITRLRESKNNTAECLNTLKITLDALEGNEKSVISQLNKNMAIEKECLGEVDEVIKSINDD
ncbi:conserved Plasmodium protein, unknown function [Plasmodium sp. DRC-Itaito]|nr:conserved Plasmodium protein, unknown function [Plasmodium sp. DRC-Itaito]